MNYKITLAVVITAAISSGAAWAFASKSLAAEPSTQPTLELRSAELSISTGSKASADRSCSVMTRLLSDAEGPIAVEVITIRLDDDLGFPELEILTLQRSAFGEATSIPFTAGELTGSVFPVSGDWATSSSADALIIEFDE